MKSKEEFFKAMENLGLALTYDDVRLKSGHSLTDPKDVSIKSYFSRNIPLLTPIVSAAMDTVTESKMAIAMAKLGGLGIIHKAMLPEDQAKHVRRVKLHLNALVENPITVNENETVETIRERRKEKDYQFHSFPVVSDDNKFVGLITRTDFDFCPDPKCLAKDAMNPVSSLVHASKGTAIDEAKKIMTEHRKRVLPLVDENGALAGMYVFSDIKRLSEHTESSTTFNMDKEGHLLVGAAVGTGPHEIERAKLLVEAGVDVLVIDTAHGDSKNVYETLKELKKLFPSLDIVVGNVSEGESAKRLVEAGADGVKVGQGPGSICTTRIVAGIGSPQVTAVYNCAKAVEGSRVPICADGGIRNSGDITIAIGAGASSVMLGRNLAGTLETPGEVRETVRGKVKMYRGMGSMGAMQASKAARERYRQGEMSKDKLVPEGVESVVQYQGQVGDIIFRQIGGLRSGMGYVGAANIKELQEKANFHRLSSAGLAESHPHDITVVEE